MSYQSTGESQPLLHQHQHQHGSDHSHSHSHQPHHHQVPIASEPQDEASLARVREAFGRRDILSSIQLHNQRAQSITPNETHDQSDRYSQYIAMLSSCIQGILISLTTIQTGYSAALSFPIILVTLLSHAFSTGFGLSCNDALHAISERLFIEGEVAREQWELEVNLQGEVDEMISLYVEKGVPQSTARKIWEAYSEDPKVFLEAMLAAECNILLPQNPLNAKQLCLVKFFALFGGSMIPFVPFVILRVLTPWVIFDPSLYPILTLIVSLGALFYLGSQRNNLYPIFHQSESIKLNNGLQILIVGVLCAAFGYGIGKLISFFPTDLLTIPLNRH